MRSGTDRRTMGPEVQQGTLRGMRRCPRNGCAAGASSGAWAAWSRFPARSSRGTSIFVRRPRTPHFARILRTRVCIAFSTDQQENEMDAPVTEEQVRALAYRLWEEAGSPEGRSDEFWALAAERLGIEAQDADPKLQSNASDRTAASAQVTGRE
ncbi:DUF2934 domain-containing protein [Caballeronia temeraria]